jgi:NitT/TauT family transport system substrate-binding protein
MQKFFIATLACLFAVLIASQAAAATVRIAILKFGTVSWEMDVVRRNGFDAAEGIKIELVELASGQSAKVALHAGSVDVIVSDLLWVSRSRTKGSDFVFAPYSASMGDLMVPPESTIGTVAELAGAKIGVAGGPLDKSWLIMRALSRKQADIDLANAAEPVFAAPPLLNQKAEQRELAAVLNYWPYSARLEAKGFKRLIGVRQALEQLGLTGDPPIVGYVFRDGWAEDNKALIEGFLRSTGKARTLMLESNAEWDLLRPLMRANSEAIFINLRNRFRSGIPKAGPNSLQLNAEELYRVLAQSAGGELVGPQTSLSPGTLWRAN